MPRRAKTLTDHADDAEARHTLTGAKRKLFRLYTTSAASRLKEVRFALSEIDSHYSPGFLDTTTGLDFKGEMFYRCSVFCAVAYSVFDVLANAANAVHQVHTNERDVSFKNIKGPTWTPHASVHGEAHRIRNRRYFERLDKQRNCALHRRSLYVQSRVIDEPEAYLPIDSTEIPRQRFSWILADDPDAVEPTTEKNHEVLTEFGKVVKWLRADAIAFMKAI